MSDNAQFALAPLVGSWRIQSVGMTWCDTKERIEPYGPNPIGYMVFVPSGRVMFLFAKADRAPPKNEVDQSALFAGMIAYTGLVRSDGPGRFVTDVDFAWNPTFEGEQVRFFSLSGNRLTIWTSEQTHPQFGDRLTVADVVWVRE